MDYLRAQQTKREKSLRKSRETGGKITLLELQSSDEGNLHDHPGNITAGFSNGTGPTVQEKIQKGSPKGEVVGKVRKERIYRVNAGRWGGIWEDEKVVGTRTEEKVSRARLEQQGCKEREKRRKKSGESG